jgi:serine/threonine protein kinase
MAESRTPCAASDLLHTWLAKTLATRSTLPAVLRRGFSPQAIGRCSSDWNGTGSGSALVRSFVTLPNLLHSASLLDGICSSHVQPVNIMLCAEEGSGALERVKILDFGIAKLGTENVSQTKSGVLMGTPAYMSPEQCRSARSAVDRSDVYALGIMMYEMLVGETPFRGGPALLMAGHMTMDPPSLAARAPSTPPELSALIHRMLAKNPSERPSAEEVARNLSSASGSISVVAAPGSAPLRVDAGTEPLTVIIAVEPS